MALTKVSSGLISADASSVDLNIDAGTLYIDATNNRVGVGTTNPLSKLHINSGASSTMQLLFGPVAAASDYAYLSWNNNAGSEELKMYSDGGFISFYANAAERMRIDSSGNVGIGYTSPNGKLNVAGRASINCNWAYNDAFIVQATQANSTTIGAYRTDGTTPILIAREDGNVGIGTSSPAQKLDVDSGHIAVDAGYGLVWSGDANRIVTPEDNSVGGLFKVAAAASTRFMRGSNESMRIDGSGNVGIGTSSPQYKLSLNDASTSAYPLVLENGNIGTPGVHTGIRFGYSGNSYQKGAIIFEGQDASARGKMYFAMEGTADSSNADETDARMTIDYSGNVGIGITTPSSLLHIVKPSGNATYLQIAQSGIESWQIGMAASSSALSFLNSGTERMRIDSNGRVQIGTTAQLYSEFLTVKSTVSYTIASERTGTGNEGHIVFHNGNGAVGTIFTNGSTTSYNTSSDARLKEVIGSARGLEVINALNPVAYNWKVDGKSDEGLIAQEVLEIVPNAITQGDDDYYQMDYSKLVTHLVAGMKEQQVLIEQLQAEVALLKGE